MVGTSGGVFITVHKYRLIERYSEVNLQIPYVDFFSCHFVFISCFVHETHKWNVERPYSDWMPRELLPPPPTSPSYCTAEPSIPPSTIKAKQVVCASRCHRTDLEQKIVCWHTYMSMTQIIERQASLGKYHRLIF